MRKLLAGVRTRAAARWIEKIRLSHWTIVELGHGPRSLGGGGFRYLEAGTSEDLPPADLVVMLDLADRLAPADFQRLLGRIQSRRLLFSFLVKPRSARWRVLAGRGSVYDTEQLSGWLGEQGFDRLEMRRLPLLPSSCLVLAERGRAGKAEIGARPTLR